MPAQQCPKCSASVRDRMHVCPQCGLVLLINGRYQLAEKIASGGFGTVYKAYDSRSRRFAVKVIAFADPGQERQIKNEITILRQGVAGLPFVPKIYDVAFQQASVSIVMEYIAGKTLNSFPRDFWRVERVERF